MIRISASVQRSFIFPAHIRIATRFYSDVRRILNFLPHISVVKEYTPAGYRLSFSSTELGVYRVKIYCDLLTEFLDDERAIVFMPLYGITPPVVSHAGIYSMVTQGYYSSKSTFHPENGNTRIEYQLEIRTDMPVPLRTRLIPTGVLEAISNSITSWRIQEIAEGFIERSLDAYQQSGVRPGPT